MEDSPDDKSNLFNMEESENELTPVIQKLSTAACSLLDNKAASSQEFTN